MKKTTVSTVCKAANPEFCRYHGSTKRSGFERRVIAHLTKIKDELALTTNLDRRSELENNLEQAEVDYAATVAGEEDLRGRLENADWAEKDKIQERIDAGLKLRESMEENEEDGVTHFPASKLPEAINRIEIANRKLKRAGIEGRFTYTTENYVRHEEDGTFTNMVNLTMSHPTIAESGWDFVAAVDKVGDGDEVITRVLPGQELDGYRPDHFECEHCHSNRRRKATYLVRNQEGEFKQVGSNCLEPFLGVKPRGLWALNYDLEADGDVIDRGDRRYGGADTAIPTEDTVAIALALSNNGESYVSAKYANNSSNLVATSQEVKNFLFSTDRASRERYANVDVEPYRAEAKRLLETTDMSGDSDYATNMRTLMKQDYIAPKHIGYVASVIAASKRNQERAERVVAPKSVGFVAPVGEKFGGVAVTVKRIIPYSDDYNYTPKAGRRIVMVTDEGKEIMWSTTGGDSTIWDAKEGSKLNLERATVKDHNTWNENDTTIVKLAKISFREDETIIA